MKIKKDYRYHVTIFDEILANREQEYLRFGKNDPNYISEFDECDLMDSMKWLRTSARSFNVKSFEEVEERIRSKFHNGRIDTTPMIEGEYFYWFDNNMLVDDQRMLHRTGISVHYVSDVEITADDLRRMAKELPKVPEVFAVDMTKEAAK